MGTRVDEDRREIARVIYILYLAGLVSGGVTAIVGVVLAHVHHSRAQEPLRSHFDWQYRTFWIGLVYAILCTLAMPVLIGFLLWGLLVIWVILRCVKGLIALSADRTVENVTTWWV